MTPEKKEITPNQKNCVSNAMPERICDGRCKICNSNLEHLKTIHDLKRTGHTFDRIVEIVREKYNLEISTASLSRHFQNYQRKKDIISARIINDDLVEGATKQATHTKQLVSLIDQAFEMIKNRIKAGTLSFDVADLERLMKLRYQVLSGQDTNETDILAIFQKASNQYGLNLQQGVLFK